MPRPHWYEPVLRLLAEQPPETVSVTLTVADLEVLAAGPLPTTAYIRSYWWRNEPGYAPHHFAAIGWRVAHMRGRPLAITFGRLPPDTTA